MGRNTEDHAPGEIVLGPNQALEQGKQLTLAWGIWSGAKEAWGSLGAAPGLSPPQLPLCPLGVKPHPSPMGPEP